MIKEVIKNDQPTKNETIRGDIFKLKFIKAKKLSNRGLSEGLLCLGLCWYFLAHVNGIYFSSLLKINLIIDLTARKYVERDQNEVI